ncbi:hypothetical protein ZIOFF_071560 [Zingiber officinale]|uniref:HTH cro/C1-type domain-containing protein n=1 Tax=Zingiber officinale TaxID=94328 RepID=A0A8J5C9Q0_ZINOF|nr:hypothetical protein ZIOFF_071560 [Zingiber officinale]
MPYDIRNQVSSDSERIVSFGPSSKNQHREGPQGCEPGFTRWGAVETVKKFDAGTNKKAGAGPAVFARKLDESTEPAVLERVGAEVRQAIQRARLAKKMSQAELAKLINERTKLVGDYESGCAVLNQAVLAKMEKVLDVKLRGKHKY